MALSAVVMLPGRGQYPVNAVDEYGAPLCKIELITVIF
jgi:hypothetical protein